MTFRPLLLLTLLLCGCASRLPTQAEVAASAASFPALADAVVPATGERLADYAARRTVLLIDGPNWRLRLLPGGRADFDTPSDSASAGVLLTGDGYVLTSAHGVRGRRSLAIVGPDRPGGPARLLRARVVWSGDDSRPPLDAALLKLEPPARPLPHLPIDAWLDAPPPRRGEPLLMTGLVPGGPDERPRLGRAAGRVLDVDRLRADGAPAGRLRVIVDAPVRPGFSGGPALDARGRLAGVTAQLSARWRRLLLVPLPALGVRYTTAAFRPAPAFLARQILLDRGRQTTTPPDLPVGRRDDHSIGSGGIRTPEG